MCIDFHAAAETGGGPRADEAFMAFTLSISTNPLVNRYAEPEDLMAIVA